MTNIIVAKIIRILQIQCVSALKNPLKQVVNAVSDAVGKFRLRSEIPCESSFVTTRTQFE